MKQFRFEGFQQDAFGGAFPLFTEVLRNAGDYSSGFLEDTGYGTTLSGRGIFEMGYILPSFPELQKINKGEILEFKERKTIDIPSKDKILDW